ncbi:MAG: MFS transporter [Acidobacteria bacterium]|nr:MFS transporter [Acidobacteriota bacterium]
MRKFYGWWIVAASFISFGISVGLPYYNVPFFYDYFAKDFGWARSQITLGFPLAALLTLWVGPLLVPKLSPRKSIIIGTGLTALAFFGFSQMTGSLAVYYGLWFMYTMGYILSGPIPHQVIVSHWFRKRRGLAMGIVYIGVAVGASLGTLLVKNITPASNPAAFHTTLLVVGALLFLAWPIAFFLHKDKPSDIGQFADGASEPPPDVKLEPRSYKELLSSVPFWLLLIGSFCSIGSIGAVNFHMKFVFQDQGFKEQAVRDAVWAAANIAILISSVLGRVFIGTMADKLNMKWVMFGTYFLVAATVPVLLMVAPPGTPWTFAVLFGLAMGADYMLIPLMAARQFGVNTLARAMAIILPVNTIGQTWFPQLVSILREHSPDYRIPLYTVFTLAMVGALAIFLLPTRGTEK